MATRLNAKHATALFLCAFFIRALVMFFYVQPNEYYKQPDSVDYHNCALSIATGNGMNRLDSKEPIFWRTPGYPPFIAFFYWLIGLKSVHFSDNWYAQSIVIWIQIFFSSFIPIILFYLAYIVTQISLIATITAWLSVIHPGLILASSFFLSEGLALIFFYLFLLFLYVLLIPNKNKHRGIMPLLFSVIFLSMYTWMRPMGEFVGYFTAILIIFAGIGSWKKATMQGMLFGFIFFLSLFPWCYRNYKLTNEWFFCPTIGTYLNVFSAPKILRRTTGKPLIECHKILGQAAAIEVRKKQEKLKGTGKHVTNNVCKRVSYPVCMNHPGYFLYDWLMEIIKTTFDLYSYQLVTITNGSWWYDPIEEYLPEKISACLYAQKLPWFARAIAWFEFIFSLLMWIGLLGGSWLFLLAK